MITTAATSKKILKHKLLTTVSTAQLLLNNSVNMQSYSPLEQTSVQSPLHFESLLKAQLWHQPQSQFCLALNDLQLVNTDLLQNHQTIINGTCSMVQNDSSTNYGQLFNFYKFLVAGLGRQLILCCVCVSRSDKFISRLI